MIADVARPPAAPARGRRTGPAARDGRRRDDAGMLSLEAVLVLPVLALLLLGLVETAGVLRDILLAHEAARVGARAAATTTGSAPVVRAARAAAPELLVEVHVRPTVRRDGDLATVLVTSRRRIGPVTHTIRARALARVEPAVGTAPARPAPP